MSGKFWNALWLFLFLYIVSLPGVRAQGMASGVFGVSPGFTLANCTSSYFTGLTTWCPTGTGQLYYCLATSACGTPAGWVLYGGTPTGAVLTGITYNGLAVPVSAAGIAAITGPTKATVTVPQASLSGTLQ
jgi:hypothetical protein